MLAKNTITGYGASAYIDDIIIEQVPACPKPLYISVDNTTANSASFRWTPGGEETQWEVKCVSTDSTDIQTLTAMTNPFVFTVVIDIVPSCARPLRVKVNDITQTSASVNWTPGNEETTWEVKCVSADSTDMLTLTATTNPFVFTGLQASTKYNVYVRAVCNADVMSEWSAPVTFTTRCLTMSLTESIYTEESNAGTLSIGYLYRNNEYYDTTSFRELYSCPITTDMTYVEHTIDSLPNGARITLRYSGGSSSSGMSGVKWSLTPRLSTMPLETCLSWFIVPLQ